MVTKSYNLNGSTIGKTLNVYDGSTLVAIVCAVADDVELQAISEKRDGTLRFAVKPYKREMVSKLERVEAAP